MIRRYIPYLFLAAAVCSLIGYLTYRRVNWWIAVSKFCHVLIALAYLPHHHFR